MRASDSRNISLPPNSDQYSSQSSAALDVPVEGFSDRHAAEILSRLGERVGERMILRLERVDRIDRGPSGKFRAVVSRVGRDRGRSAMFPEGP